MIRMILKCESVRGVRDADDKQLSEAVCLKSVVIPDAQDHFVASVNITTDTPEDWGTYEKGGIYVLTLEKQA